MAQRWACALTTPKKRHKACACAVRRAHRRCATCRRRSTTRSFEKWMALSATQREQTPPVGVLRNAVARRRVQHTRATGARARAHVAQPREVQSGTCARRGFVGRREKRQTLHDCTGKDDADAVQHATDSVENWSKGRFRKRQYDSVAHVSNECNVDCQADFQSRTCEKV